MCIFLLHVFYTIIKRPPVSHLKGEWALWCIARNANYKNSVILFLDFAKLNRKKWARAKRMPLVAFVLILESATLSRENIYILVRPQYTCSNNVCICASTQRLSDFASFCVRAGANQPTNYSLETAEGARKGSDCYEQKPHGIEIWNAAQIAAGPFVINMSQ